MSPIVGPCQAQNGLGNTTRSSSVISGYLVSAELASLFGVGWIQTDGVSPRSATHGPAYPTTLELSSQGSWQSTQHSHLQFIFAHLTSGIRTSSPVWIWVAHNQQAISFASGALDCTPDVRQGRSFEPDHFCFGPGKILYRPSVGDRSHRCLSSADS